MTCLIRVCVQERELAQAELDGESHSHLHQHYIYYTEVSGLRGDRLKILFCVVSGELLQSLKELLLLK